MKKQLLAILICTTLAACGGGSGSSSGETTPPAGSFDPASFMGKADEPTLQLLNIPNGEEIQLNQQSNITFSTGTVIYNFNPTSSGKVSIVVSGNRNFNFNVTGQEEIEAPYSDDSIRYLVLDAVAEQSYQIQVNSNPGAELNIIVAEANRETLAIEDGEVYFSGLMATTENCFGSETTYTPTHFVIDFTDNYFQYGDRTYDRYPITVDSTGRIFNFENDFEDASRTGSIMVSGLSGSIIYQETAKETTSNGDNQTECTTKKLINAMPVL
ncbi:hypothetical protein [Pelagibaculum spongiae]|uniref:DUF4397 domain-containing protein n=1 Tax=Pelagibaculum spongiae TaxID=2080658 RepID=A0A2V1H2E5_9GAMM|nr:hypothetical protein [Pelagibaculum spongiae]PVZ70189.1 hypothetical protein DC094_06185 [Pelagibaculum spongiae]